MFIPINKTFLMIRFIVSFLFINFSLNGYAQNEHLDSLLDVKAPVCYQIAQNSIIQIDHYLVRQQIDSVDVVLNYWEYKCGTNPELLTLQELFNIYKTGASSYSTLWLDYFAYDRTYSFQFNRFGYSHEEQTNKYDKLRNQIAQLAEKVPNLSELDKAFVEFHLKKNKWLFEGLSKHKFEGERIQTLYNAKVARLAFVPLFRYEINGGAWIPQRNASLLGAHPTLGVKLGVNFKRITHDIVANLKFANTKNQYQVIKPDSTYNTNYFFGGYIGYQLGIKLIQSEKVQGSVIACIGYDGFSAVKKESSDNNTDTPEQPSVIVQSFAASTGLSLTYNWSPFGYLGADILYHFTNFSTNGGTNLSGDVIELKLTIGGFGNITKKNAYHKLGKMSDLNRYKYEFY